MEKMISSSQEIPDIFLFFSSFQIRSFEECALPSVRSKRHTREVTLHVEIIQFSLYCHMRCKDLHRATDIISASNTYVSI